MEDAGLLKIFSDDIEARKYAFRSNWTTEDIDKHLRSIFPKPFEWQAKHGVKKSADSADWVLLVKEGLKLFKYSRDKVTGKDMGNVRGASGRKWNTYMVHFGKLYAINVGFILISPLSTSQLSPVKFLGKSGNQIIGTKVHRILTQALLIYSFYHLTFHPKGLGSGVVQSRI
jgi:hypothetical protein